VKTSQVGVDLIKQFEGFRTKSYLCPAGVWTIGYGHTGPDVKADQEIKASRAEYLLKQDLIRFEEAVSKSVKIKLEQNQFDALVSFAFNVGVGAFESSTLLRRLNSGEDPCSVAKAELPRWDKANGKSLEGLKRRRSAEVELFCKEPPTPKTGMIDITSIQQTWLKKKPVPSPELPNDEKAIVPGVRTYRNCRVLDRKDNHTLLEFSFGLGTWWVFDRHWKGLVKDTSIHRYAVDGDLRYLRNFPYFYQQDNGPEGWRQCQTSSIAMCLKYIDTPGINDDLDYLKIVKKYGDTTQREPHYRALAELGVSATFTTTADDDAVKAQIDKGLPVAAGILHHGAVSAPTGGGHFVVISGYDSKSWLVQDPYGELDMVNGAWEKTGPTVGRNVRYSFKNFEPRFCPDGGANGWCWYGFRLLKK
jgi:lysozyme